MTTIDYSQMAHLAINKRIDKLYAMYDSVIANDIKTITVPAYTKTIDKYISESVLIYVFGSWKIEDAENFINRVRQHHTVYYDAIMHHLISESRMGSKMRHKVELLINMANLDNYQINYQKLVNCSLECNSKLSKILKKEADKINYVFDFDAMKKCSTSVKKLVKWANQKNQVLDLDIQKLIMKLVPREIDMLEYYLKLNQKVYHQNLNFDQIIDMLDDQAAIALIKQYVPADYVYETYPDELVIDLTQYEGDALKSLLDDLIRFCYNMTEISYVVYKDRKYYNSTNQWYDRKELPGDENRDYDPDMKCDQYDSDCDFDRIYPRKSDNVEYIINYFSENQDFNRKMSQINPLGKNIKLPLGNDEYQNLDLIRKIFHTNPEKITLTGYDFILLHNPCGVNPDHRGSDHCQIYLKCYDTFKVACPVNLYTFANNLYRVKSHKWDKWYELYCRVDKTEKVVNNEFNIVDKEGKLSLQHTATNGIRVTMCFDHGS